MTQFEILLDVLESSPQVSWVDFELEIEWVKGAIHFGYDGKKYEMIFNEGILEKIEEVS